LIDGAGAVAFHHVLVFAEVGGQEDDRDRGGLLPLLDHLGQLEAVHIRHLDVEHQQREFLGDEREQRLVRGAGAHQAVGRVFQHGLERDEIFRLVIDQQDVDPLVLDGAQGLHGARGFGPHAVDFPFVDWIGVHGNWIGVNRGYHRNSQTRMRERS
jgi:hypothetical protein